MKAPKFVVRVQAGGYPRWDPDGTRHWCKHVDHVPRHLSRYAAKQWAKRMGIEKFIVEREEEIYLI